MHAERARIYGDAPFRVVVLHGGPGSVGSAAPLAEQLADSRGVLEPLLRASSVKGQIEAVLTALENHADAPVVLIGHSWGALLALLVAARSPDAVRNVVMVSTMPCDPSGIGELARRRAARLSATEHEEFVRGQILMKTGKADARVIDRYDRLVERTDRFDVLPSDGGGEDEFLPQVYARIWYEISELQRTGRVAEAAQNVRCPVVAIHGVDDPHPVPSVAELGATLSDFELVELQRCGHVPWIERHARDEFFDVLERHLPDGEA